MCIEEQYLAGWPWESTWYSISNRTKTQDKLKSLNKEVYRILSNIYTRNAEIVLDGFHGNFLK